MIFLETRSTLLYIERIECFLVKMQMKLLSEGLITRIIIFGTLPAIVLANDILKTQGFTTCLDNSTITVTNLDIQYDRSARAITFDVGGASSREQKVMASLTVTAYGKEVYKKDFNPCADDTKVTQLCPGKYAFRLCASIFC